jgi:hypothetical protein
VTEPLWSSERISHCQTLATGVRSHDGTNVLPNPPATWVTEAARDLSFTGPWKTNRRAIGPFRTGRRVTWRHVRPLGSQRVPAVQMTWTEHNERARDWLGTAFAFAVLFRLLRDVANLDAWPWRVISVSLAAAVVLTFGYWLISVVQRRRSRRDS